MYHEMFDDRHPEHFIARCRADRERYLAEVASRAERLEMDRLWATAGSRVQTVVEKLRQVRA